MDYEGTKYAEFEDITTTAQGRVIILESAMSEFTDLINHEIGTRIKMYAGRIESFQIIEVERIAHVDPVVIKPREITHGPQRKGRGGKVRKW